MNLSELLNISVPIVAADNAIKVGTSNKIILSEKVAKLKLGYQEGDEFIMLEVSGDYNGLVITCGPSDTVKGSKKFNKGTFCFGDKDISAILGETGSEWDIEVEFNTLDLPDGRKCPLYTIEQKIDGKQKQKEIESRYKTSKETSDVKTVTPEVEIKPQNEDITVESINNVTKLEEEFESEAPTLEYTTNIVDNSDYQL